MGRGVRDASSGSSSSSSNSGSSSNNSSSSSESDSDSANEANTKVHISSSLFSKTSTPGSIVSLNPSLPHHSDKSKNIFSDFNTIKKSKLDFKSLNNSELKSVKKCDINFKEHSKLGKDNKGDGLDIHVSVSQRTATNHDRCKTPNPEPRISSLFNQSAPLTKSNSVTPVFSNLYRSSTPFNAFTLTTNPFQSTTKLLGPTLRPLGTPVKLQTAMEAATSTRFPLLRPGGSMMSLINSVSNNYLGKSSLLGTNTLATSGRNTSIANSSSYDEDKPWGFAAAAAHKTLELCGLDKGGVVLSTDKKGSTSVSSTFDKNMHRPGFGQLRGLFDGLSHLFATPAAGRSRGTKTPNYNPGRRKKRSEIAKCRDKVGVVDARIKKVPKPTVTVTAGEESATVQRTEYMSPSSLVKTAVNSKRHEFERRRLLKGEGPLFFGSNTMDPLLLGGESNKDDPKVQKRQLIAEATQTHHHAFAQHHPVPSQPSPPPQTMRPSDRSGKKFYRPHHPFCFLT